MADDDFRSPIRPVGAAALLSLGWQLFMVHRDARWLRLVKCLRARLSASKGQSSRGDSDLVERFMKVRQQLVDQQHANSLVADLLDEAEIERDAAQAEANNMRQAQVLNDAQLTAWEPVVEAAQVWDLDRGYHATRFAGSLQLREALDALKDSATGEANAPAAESKSGDRNKPAPTVPEQKGDAGAGAVAQLEPASGLLADGECQCCGTMAGDELNELLQCPACTVMLKEAARCPQCDELVVDRDRLAERVHRMDQELVEQRALLLRVEIAERREDEAEVRTEVAKAERDVALDEARVSDAAMIAVIKRVEAVEGERDEEQRCHQETQRRFVEQEDEIVEAFGLLGDGGDGTFRGRIESMLTDVASAVRHKCCHCGVTNNKARDGDLCWSCGQTSAPECAQQQPKPQPAADKCPTCDSPQPHLHPAMQHEGEVQPCQDTWHKPALDRYGKPQPSPSVEVPEQRCGTCQNNKHGECSEIGGRCAMVGDDWGKHCSVYIVTPTPPLLLARDGGDAEVLREFASGYRSDQTRVGAAVTRAIVVESGPVAEFVRQVRRGQHYGWRSEQRMATDRALAALPPELRKLGELGGGDG